MEDTNATYRFSDISLKYDVILDGPYVPAISKIYTEKTSNHYTKVTSIHY